MKSSWSDAVISTCVTLKFKFFFSYSIIKIFKIQRRYPGLSLCDYLWNENFIGASSLW